MSSKNQNNTKKRKLIGITSKPEKKRKTQNKVQEGKSWSEFTSLDLDHSELQPLKTIITSLPWDGILFFVDLDQISIPIGSFLHWLLFSETLPPSVIVIVCKSSFVQLECTSCHTKFGNMKPLDNRILGKNVPSFVQNFSVLDFYCFLVSGIVSYRYNFVLLTNDEPRANHIINELQSQAKKGYHLSITSLNQMDKETIKSISYLSKFVTEFSDHQMQKPVESTSAEEDPSEYKFQGHTLDALTEYTLQSVVGHVREWILNFQKGTNSGHLPKTRPKLENSIRRLCCWKYSASPRRVMENLQNDGLIRFCEDCGSLFYPEREKITISPPTPSSTILSQITEKVKEWIHTQPSLPSSPTGLRNQISSIKIPQSAEPSHVVQTLIEKKIVCPVIPEIEKKEGHMWSSYSYSIGVEEKVEYTCV